jgi:hypothetical protein
MSFGYSAGDFFTAIQLIVEVASALREAGGSAQEYQKIHDELDTLKAALEQVANLEHIPGLEETVYAIKSTVATCHVPLREFLASIQHYDASLNKSRAGGVMKDVAYKIRWRATKKAESVSKLRSEICGYVGSINMLIGLYQMCLITLSSNLLC